MRKSNRELEIFESEHLLNKEEVLASIDSYIEHCEESQEERWSLAKRHAVVDLCKRFRREVEALEDFEVEEDWQFYDYHMTGEGIQLELLICTDIEIAGDEEIESMSWDDLQEMLYTKCRYLTVNEFADMHGVTDTTVRQWIRRGKIRHAKKSGRDWLISELTDYPKRGYDPVTYMWDKPLQGEEFKELSGYHSLIILQDREDKKIFKGVLGRFENKEQKEFIMSIKEREKLELALISRDDVDVFEIEDNIMFKPTKYKADVNWKSELEGECTEQGYLTYGPVIVTKGKHKGRIGYMDDEEGEYGVVYWGDMLLSLDYYEMIKMDYLSNDISTNQLVKRNQELRREVSIMRARPNTNYFKATQLMTELLYVEQILSKRYYEAVFLKPEQEMEVFISYASEDVAFARTLATDLIEKGYKVFLADWSIEVGDNIWTEIEKGIENAKVLIPIISKEFLESVFCKNEWQAFYNGSKEKERPIIPIIINESELPGMLSNFKYYRLDSWDGSYEKVLSAVLKKLKKENKE